jgi:hypothetical protein
VNVFRGRLPLRAGSGLALVHRRAVTTRAKPVSEPDLSLTVPEPDPVPLLRVSAEQLAQDPDRVWQEVVNRLMDVGDLEHLRFARTQRVAWLVLRYDAHVRAEGHAQYFRTYGVGRAAETRIALAELGADAQAHLLNTAIGRDLAYPDDYATSVPTGGGLFAIRGTPPDYTDLDIPYRLTAADVRARLHRYMLTHLREFLEIQGDAEEAVSGLLPSSER